MRAMTPVSRGGSNGWLYSRVRGCVNRAQPAAASLLIRQDQIQQDQDGQDRVREREEHPTSYERGHPFSCPSR